MVIFLVCMLGEGVVVFVMERGVRPKYCQATSRAHSLDQIIKFSKVSLQNTAVSPVGGNMSGSKKSGGKRRIDF